MNQRLGAASELLKAGDAEKALEFALPALTVVTVGTIDFLSELRAKNSKAADSLYASLLLNSATNPDADANTVSILFSYIFSPHLYITFSGAGASTSQKSSTVTPEPVTPQLRATFFQSAASILLRPLPPPGQPDQSSSGLDGKYLVIKRLLPFFEQFAPAQTVEPLRFVLKWRENTRISRTFRKTPTVSANQSAVQHTRHSSASTVRRALNTELRTSNRARTRT